MPAERIALAAERRSEAELDARLRAPQQRRIAWLALVALVAFAVILLAAGRSRMLSQIVAIVFMALSWLMGVSVVWTVITQHKDLGMTNVFQSHANWLVNGSSGAGSGICGAAPSASAQTGSALHFFLSDPNRPS